MAGLRQAGTSALATTLAAAGLMGVALPASYDGARPFNSLLTRDHPHFQQRPKAGKKKRGKR